MWTKHNKIYRKYWWNRTEIFLYVFMVVTSGLSETLFLQKMKMKKIFFYFFLLVIETSSYFLCDTLKIWIDLQSVYRERSYIYIDISSYKNSYRLFWITLCKQVYKKEVFYRNRIKFQIHIKMENWMLLTNQIKNKVLFRFLQLIPLRRISLVQQAKHCV